MLNADYRRLVGELAAVTIRRDADLAATEQSYQDGIAELRSELVAAAAAVSRAEDRVAAATAAIEEADREAARLWARLRRRRLGTVPEPAFTGESTVEGVRALLASAASSVERAAMPSGPLPRWAALLLPLFGAVAAAAMGLVAGWLAHTGLRGLVGLSWVVFLLAPFAGLPIARWWAGHRFGAGLDTGTIGLTVLGGMVACTALVLTYG